VGTRRHGETSAIVEVMTRDHGRHLGLVRGGSGTRLRPLLQPGNTVRVVWRARLDEHLGHYAVEPLHLHGASQLAAAHVVYGVTHLGALCRLLPERDPHPEVHDHLAAMLERLDDPVTAGLEMVRFELQMLVELGFGLDLASCAATGAEDDLGYVSPKSGRAVSRTAAAPWQDRLFRLPAFLSEAVKPSLDDIADGFALTDFSWRAMCSSRAGSPLPTPAKALLPRSWGGGFRRAWRSKKAPDPGPSAAGQRLFLVAYLPAPQLAAFLANAVRRHRLLRRPRHLRTVRRSIRDVGPLIGRRRVTAGTVGNG
jgi:DNA repair protein RecO (recombination protein O)